LADGGLAAGEWSAFESKGGKVVEKNQSDSADAYFARGDQLFQKGENAQAREQWHEAIRIDPHHLIAHYNLGLSFLQDETFDEAEKEFREVLHIDPDDPDAHRGLAEVFDQQGELEHAIYEYRELLRLCPKDDETRRDLIFDLVDAGYLAEAQAELNRLELKMPSSDAKLWAKLGGKLNERNALFEATRAYKNALVLDPNQDDIRARLKRIAPGELKDIPKSSKQRMTKAVGVSVLVLAGIVLLGMATCLVFTSATRILSSVLVHRVILQADRQLTVAELNAAKQSFERVSFWFGAAPKHVRMQSPNRSGEESSRVVRA